jgi:hypothetical protein
MRRGRTAAVPKTIEELRQRLEHWRSTHKRRGRIPEALWAEAAELARQHGVYQTARTLRLEYTRLWYWSQKLCKPAGRALDAAAPPEFVELITPPAADQSECVIEWESERGKVTIHLKGTTMPDLSALSRALWSRP